VGAGSSDGLAPLGGGALSADETTGAGSACGASCASAGSAVRETVGPGAGAGANAVGVVAAAATEASPAGVVAPEPSRPS
jgi:hypothetical protein